MKQQAETILREFGDYIGIPDLAFDEDNLCTLSFDDLVVCFAFREESKQLLLYADVGTLPSPAPLPALAALLEANCLQPEGTALGIRLDEERNLYVVALSCLADLAGLEQSRFQDLVQHFLSVQEEWQKRLSGPLDQMADKQTPANANGGDAFQQSSSSIRA